jgi:hypothetical protein
MKFRSIINGKSKLIAVALCVLVVLGLLSACDSKAQTSKKDASLQKILDSGELVLGLDAAFPPMGFIDDSGEIVGFDIDVAQSTSQYPLKNISCPHSRRENESDLPPFCFCPNRS